MSWPPIARNLKLVDAWPMWQYDFVFFLHMNVKRFWAGKEAGQAFSKKTPNATASDTTCAAQLQCAGAPESN